jgi:hypothetical protein
MCARVFEKNLPQMEQLEQSLISLTFFKKAWNNPWNNRHNPLWPPNPSDLALDYGPAS